MATSVQDDNLMIVPKDTDVNNILEELNERVQSIKFTLK